MDKVIINNIYIWLSCKIERMDDNQAMCRMLGLIGKEPDYNLLPEFQKLAVIGKIRAGMEPGHLDGWGMAGFVKDKAIYFARSYKAANKGVEYNQASELAIRSKTAVLVSHIRKASSGDVCLKNTHPFIKNSWIFGHNGTIYNAENMPLNNLKPKGITDSERFFCFLLEHIGNSSMLKDLNFAIQTAVSFIQENNDYTSLTFLLTNGKYLIAYRDYNENSDKAGQFAGYYTLYLSRADGFVAVCSEPIGNLNFRPLQNKELLILT